MNHWFNLNNLNNISDLFLIPKTSSITYCILFFFELNNINFIRTRKLVLLKIQTTNLDQT